MFDRYIRRRDEHRFGMRKHVEAILAVVMPHAGWSDGAERHRLDKQVDVDLVDGAAAERKLADEAVDCRLVTTEDERREGMSWLAVLKSRAMAFCNASSFSLTIFPMRSSCATRHAWERVTLLAK